MLSNLAKVADSKVISRTSVMKFKPGADRNLKQIANDLGVNYIVEGTVQRDAARVHVTVELIDARTDTQAWADTFDGQLADVLSFQSEIAERVTNQLGAKLSPRENTELAGRPTKDIAAYESYIRAKALVESVHDDEDVTGHQRFVETQQRAIQLLEQATARDGGFVLAYCALAEANTQLYRSEGPVGVEQFRTMAASAVNNAQRLAPEAGESLYAKSRFIYYVEHDFHAALAMLERAANVLPNNADVTLTRAYLYRRFGRWQEAYAQFVRTTELNPTDPAPYGLAAATATGLRWWDEADRMRARIFAKFPRAPNEAKVMAMMTLRLRGEVEAGNKLMDELHLTVADGFAPLFYRAFWNRDYAECRRLLDQAAAFPQLEDERWQKEAYLVFVTKDFRSRDAAVAVKEKLEERWEQQPAGGADDTAARTVICVRFITGNTAEAVQLAEQLVERYPISEDALQNMGYLDLLVQAYLFAGDRERSLKTLEQSLATPNMFFAYGRMKNDPLLDQLRGDPRFERLLEQSRQPFPRQ